jgi:UrcA family protein
MNRRKLISILAFTACVFQSAWVSAGPGEQVRTRTVHYSDLNLSRAADAAVLYGRIERAADYVCGSFTTGDLTPFARYKRCKTAALDQAFADLHAPRVKGPRAAMAAVQIQDSRGATLSP